MHDQPSVPELIQAVKNFVDETASPELTGRAAFHARVASNVLGTLLRDIESRAENEAEELGRLRVVLGQAEGAKLSEMNLDLQKRIRSGDMTPKTAGLLDHLKKTAIAQLKVDQPGYSGLANALKEL